MKLFDFSLKISGYPLAKAQKTLKTIQSIKETDYDNYIAAKKEEIVNYHITNNSFYKSFAKSVNSKDWNSIPVMYKSDLQHPLQMLLSPGYTKSNVYINKTSGSSGHPFIFAKDKFCHALTWSVIINRFSWFDIDFNHSKQARFYGIPKDKKGYYKEKLKDFLGNKKRFNVFDLSDQAFENWIQVFKSTRFKYINGYTSPIVQFAKYLKKKNIILRDICPTLDVCIVTSEMLFESDKSLMEIQFGVPVINEYGASELDLIAFENPKKEWILNNETLFVEVLDNNDNPLPNGEEGRLVITSLYNKAQAFIRYDIGDIGIISEKSTPKKCLLKKLVGRTNDIVVLPSGKKAAGLTFYYITKSIIEKDSLVKEFVIEQHKIDTFKIKYLSDKTLSSEKEAMIKTEMTNYLEKGLHIVFEKQDNLNRSTSGKLKQFISLIN